VRAIHLLGEALVVFLGRLLLTLLGWATGGAVGLLFTEPFLLFFEKLGVTGLSLAEIGAVLGFISSFFNPVRLDAD
jgi:hypothetical protein